jgi:hypothetical protein
LVDIALVAFEDQRNLVAKALINLAIEAVVGDVQLAIGKPFEERSIALIEDLGKGVCQSSNSLARAEPKSLRSPSPLQRTSALYASMPDTAAFLTTSSDG